MDDISHVRKDSLQTHSYDKNDCGAYLALGSHDESKVNQRDGWGHDAARKYRYKDSTATFELRGNLKRDG